jgi:putative FmdB family regulatory protein
MPIYEYRCRACGQEFQQLVRGQTARVVCPSCQSPEVRRTLSLFGIGGGSGPAPSPGGGACCGPGGCGCR